MSGLPDEKCWQIPRSWKWVPFFEVVDISSNLVKPDEISELPHVAPDNIQSGSAKLLPFNTIGEDGVVSPKHHFLPGQVLYSKIRPYLRKAVLVDFEGGCSADMYPLTASEGIDTRYLLNWLVSEDFTDFAIRHQGRTVLPKINQDALNQTPLPLPPLAEQKRIVAKLDALNAKSARARTELARIETLVSRYKQAVLSKAFSGELTREWRHLSLGDTLRHAQVGLVRSKEQQFTKGGAPYVRMNHFDLQGRWKLDDITYVEASGQELLQYALQPGDILFNTRNSFELVGKVAFWEGREETFLYNNNILRMRFGGSIDPKFAFYQMQSSNFRTYLESVKSATTSVCAIYQKSLMQAPFFAPGDLAQQHDVVRRIEIAFAKVDRLAAEARRALGLLGKLDEATFAKAFRGELVSQDEGDEPAEKLVERIRAERQAAPEAKRGRRKTA
ncbi:restriction endonuclease subunit S [Rhizobium ruizarguesonis]